MIGVGILSLPFVVAQVGLALGLVLLVAMGAVNLFVLRLYGDLVLMRAGKARFIHVIGRELGHAGTTVASIAFIGSTYGALVAYLLFGGQFLRALLYQWIPMSPLVASIWFFLVASIVTLGGSLLVMRTQRILIPVYLILIAVLALVALPHIDGGHYATIVPANIMIPLGVMLFAFQGMTALPEMRDVLARRRALLGKSTMIATAIVALVYIVFTVVIVGVTGARTTENAIVGLGGELGHVAVMIASAIALVTTLTAYLNVTNALVNTYTFDLRLRFIPSWMLTAMIPFALVVLGVHSIASVLGITGGVLGSITAIMMLLAYERARSSGSLPKNALRVPQWVVGLAFAVFVVVMVGTIVGGV